MNMTTSQNKLTVVEAQRLFAALTKSVLAQIEIVAHAELARDRVRAMRRLERALAALADQK